MAHFCADEERHILKNSHKISFDLKFWQWCAASGSPGGGSWKVCCAVSKADASPPTKQIVAKSVFHRKGKKCLRVRGHILLHTARGTIDKVWPGEWKQQRELKVHKMTFNPNKGAAGYRTQISGGWPIEGDRTPCAFNFYFHSFDKQ